MWPIRAVLASIVFDRWINFSSYYLSTDLFQTFCFDAAGHMTKQGLEKMIRAFMQVSEFVKDKDIFNVVLTGGLLPTHPISQSF